MKKLLFIFPIVLSVLFISCSDEDNSDDNGNTQRISIRDYSASGDEIYQFSYRADGKLETILETDIDGDADRYHFNYDSSGKLISTVVKNDKTGKTLHIKSYTYTNNLTIDVFEEDYSKNEYGEFRAILTLNNKGQLVQQSFPNSSRVFRYEYDDNGNLTKLETDYYAYTYSYDNMASHLSNQGLPAWYLVYDANEDFDLYAGSNNLLESFYDGKREDSYRYDYDKNGYPTTVYDNITGKKIGVFAYDDIKK